MLLPPQHHHSMRSYMIVETWMPGPPALVAAGDFSVDTSRALSTTALSAWSSLLTHNAGRKFTNCRYGGYLEELARACSCQTCYHLSLPALTCCLQKHFVLTPLCESLTSPNRRKAGTAEIAVEGYSVS